MFHGEENQSYIVCDCGANFVLEEDYQEHLVTNHGYVDKIKYKCSMCNILFETEEACTDHVRTHGSQEKPNKNNIIHKYVCEMCGKKYGSNAALGYHQRVHTGERPYQCSMCPKSFTMPLFLQIHLRTHTGEKPYQCDTCSKAFTNKAGLLRHNRVHSGEKPYSCPRCGKTFQQSNSMKLHVKTVHDKMPAPYKKNKNNKMLSMEFFKNEHGYTVTDTANVASRKKYLYLRNYEIVDNIKIEPFSLAVESEAGSNNEINAIKLEVL